MIKKVSNEYFLISFSPKVDSGGNRPSDHIGAPTFTCSVSKERRKTINIIIYLDFQSTKRALLVTRIDSMFVSSTAVHTYDFHLFTAIIHPFEDLFGSNIMTRSQLAC